MKLKLYTINKSPVYSELRGAPMRLLKLAISGDSLFAGSRMEMDFYASDRVTSKGDGPVEVTRVGDCEHIYSLNIVGIGGVNASGKTTTLKLLILALSALQGNYIARGVGPEIAAIPAKLGGDFSIEAIFWHEGELYYLKSDLSAVRLADASQVVVVFRDESLWKFVGKRLPKKILASFSDFLNECELVCTRRGDRAVPPEILRALGDGVSIVRTITGNTSVPRVPDGRLGEGTLPSSVVRVFDPSVDYLIWDDEADVFRLKFRDEPERSVSRSAAETVLSSGTISGTELVMNAVDALREGGYLLVDEIENSLNKTLVASVMSLFSSPVTNPRGALLVFTTHYPELLDELERKDNLYLLVRGEDCRSQVVKYSDRIDRIENKKSEVLLSNLIHGSTPSYPLVRDMREFVRKSVDG